MMEPKDESTLERCLRILRDAEFDERAWTDLYHTLWPYVVTLVLRRLSFDRQRAEEITQNVFVNVVRARIVCEITNPDELRRYLRRAATNCVHDYLRREQREIRKIEAVRSLAQEESLASPEAAIELEYTLEDLRLNLRTSETELLNMLVEGHDSDEISDALGITRGAVRIRVSRLRQQIRRYLRADREA
jgi:RNA polymerase sigma factor (sigma-70 family)